MSNLYMQNELGTWCYKSKSSEIYHEGYMFPLLVTQQLELWPEKNLRQRVWVRTFHYLDMSDYKLSIYLFYYVLDKM